MIEAQLDPALRKRQDAVGVLGIDWSRLRIRIGRLIAASSGDLADTVLSQVNSFNRRDVQRILTIDIDDEPQAIRRELTRLRRENVVLIRSLGADLLTDLRSTISESVREGRRVEDLREVIAERFSVSESRAELIATDQTLKANADLTRIRHREAGIEKYRWSTSLDEKVRSAHQALEGRIFSWDDPPITNEAGDRNHPGGDYRCRCGAIPVLG